MNSTWKGVFEAVLIIPTTPDPETWAAAVRSMKGRYYKCWIHVRYGGSDMDVTQAITDGIGGHPPIDVIDIPELPLDQAIRLRGIPPLYCLKAWADKDPSTADDYHSLTEFWDTIRTPIKRAIYMALNLESPSPI